MLIQNKLFAKDRVGCIMQPLHLKLNGWSLTYLIILNNITPPPIITCPKLRGISNVNNMRYRHGSITNYKFVYII